MITGEREVQKNYWMEHSIDLTEDVTILDSKDADLDKEDRLEVIFYSLFIYSSFH